VDHDPVVVNHGKALLASRDGTTDIVQADLRDTATSTGKAGKTLDFGQPIAVLLIGVLHFIPDVVPGVALSAGEATPSDSPAGFLYGFWAEFLRSDTGSSRRGRGGRD